MAWKRHDQQSEMAVLFWRAKTAFPKLNIILLHESAEERKPHEESLWK
jgi:hypothetical protein